MEAHRIMAVLLVAVANLTIYTSALAQQPPEESLALTVDRGRVVAGHPPPTFTVNPEFETLDQPWDERFGEPFKIPEYFANYMAFMAGIQPDSEETVEEFLTGLEETGRRLVLSAEPSTLMRRHGFYWKMPVALTRNKASFLTQVIEAGWLSTCLWKATTSTISSSFLNHWVRASLKLSSALISSNIMTSLVSKRISPYKFKR